VLPSSLTTAVMMALAGRLIWGVGPRTMLATGMLVMIAALVNMSRWTLAAGWDQLFWPQVLRGVAMGLMFVPVSVATLRSLPPAEVAAGAGLYNLFRQLGGSFGVALLTTLLDRRAEVHRFQLSEHVGPLDPVAALRLDELTRAFAGRGLGGGAAERAASAALDAQVGAAAQLHALQDAYLWIALLFVLALPLLLCVAREAPGKAEARAAG
jgi:DHA2 family multidrug resistance protein